MERFLQATTALEQLVAGASQQVDDWLLYEASEVRLTDIQGFLRRGNTWADLSRLAWVHGILWISDSNFVLDQRALEVLDDSLAEVGIAYLGYIRVDFGDRSANAKSCLEVWSTHRGEHAFDTLFEILGRKKARFVEVEGNDEMWPDDGDEDFHDSSVSADVLALLKVHEQVEFGGLSFAETQCQVLAEFTGSVSFSGCRLADGGSAMFEATGRNQGPIHLCFVVGIHGWLAQESLRNMLSDTTSLETFEFDSKACMDVHFVAQGLEQNESLTKLSFSVDFPVEWDDVIRSLRNHPTLQRLVLMPTYSQRNSTTSAENKIRRARALANILDTNCVLEDISDPTGVMLDVRILQEQIQPRLKANLRQARFQALLDEKDDEQLRKKLVIAAVSHREAYSDPAFMFLLVSSFYSHVTDQYQTTREQRAVNGPVSAGTKRKRK